MCRFSRLNEISLARRVQFPNFASAEFSFVKDEKHNDRGATVPLRDLWADRGTRINFFVIEFREERFSARNRIGPGQRSLTVKSFRSQLLYILGEIITIKKKQKTCMHDHWWRFYLKILTLPLLCDRRSPFCPARVKVFFRRVRVLSRPGLLLECVQRRHVLATVSFELGFARRHAHDVARTSRRLSDRGCPCKFRSFTRRRKLQARIVFTCFQFRKKEKTVETESVRFIVLLTSGF